MKDFTTIYTSHVRFGIPTRRILYTVWRVDSARNNLAEFIELTDRRLNPLYLLAERRHRGQDCAAHDLE